MQRYTARQPIFNQYKKVLAYELLYRESLQNFFPAHISADVATSSMLVNTFLDARVEEITDGKPALINFTEATLLDGFTDIAPNKNIIIEILETVTPSDELYEAVRNLFHRGYRIALDDFTFDPEWDRFLKFVKILKVDIQTHPLASISHELHRVRKIYKGKFLAEKVETYEEFALARSMGFDFYQGYFFCKPEIVENKSIDFSNSLLMQVYTEAVRPEINFSKLDVLFKQDAGLSAKLFRYVKNVTPKLSSEISSIRQALIRLGTDAIRKFTLILVTSELTTKKPSELLKTSVYRARFCELMLKKSPLKDYSDRGFLVGLFSTLDAILDMPLDRIMQELPVDNDIKLALVQDVGVLAGVLQIIKHYERGDWESAEIFCEQIGLSIENLNDCYKKSVSWDEKTVTLI